MLERERATVLIESASFRCVEGQSVYDQALALRLELSALGLPANIERGGIAVLLEEKDLTQIADILRHSKVDPEGVLSVDQNLSLFFARQIRTVMERT